MNTASNERVSKILCGELCKSNTCTSKLVNLTNFDVGDVRANITTKYNKFVEDPHALSERTIDLLEIAAYVFCADRSINRGSRYSVKNNAWGRSLDFEIPVNDIDFWNAASVKNSLENALAFMTGDKEYRFSFTKAKATMLSSGTYQMSLFTMAGLDRAIGEDVDIMLFSGGLDSLAGAIDRLNTYPERKLCLVNHMSNNRSIKAQRVLVNELKKRFGDRVIPYTFECRFKKADSRDETQRTRMFLFSAIAFAICNQYGKNSFYVYENGVTSINLPKQTDLMHARASRTTHPKTIGLLNEFYRQFSSEFTIDTPYRMLTKEEIVRKFIDYKEEILIQSSVSCSTTRNYHELAPHCGCCSQCIDRRFATFAAGLAADFDDTYVLNLPYDKLNDEAAQRVANTLMFANTGIGDSATEFLSRYPSELMDVIPFWPASPDESLAEVYQLFCKYRDSIYRAEKAMNDSFSQLQLLDGSFLDRISEKKSHDDIEREKFESCIEHSVFVIINQSKTRQGSGFHLMDYGLITSHHVTCDGDFYDVFRYTEHPTKCGTISKEIGELCDDEQIDYALYKQIISVSCCFDIGDSQAMKIGDPVKIIGYPGFQTGDTYDCKKAELSRKTTLFGTPLFVVSSTIFHGESGGVVLNMNNQIVGLIRAGVESADEEPSSGKQGFVPIHLIIENIAQQGA